MNNKGFTLLEIVITMGLISIIGVLLVVIIVNSTGVFYKESTRLSEGLHINDTLSSIRENIRQSSGVVTSYTSSGVTYTSSSTQLVLKVGSRDSSNNLIANVYDYFVFYQDQNKFWFKVFPDVLSSRKSKNQILTTFLETVNFQYFNSATPPVEVLAQNALKVRITLSLTQKNGNLIERKIATSEASIRND